MSFYEVRVFDGNNNLKRVHSSEQLGHKHWGENHKCGVCGSYYLPKLRRGSQGMWIEGCGTHDIKKVPDRSPEKGFCSNACRVKNMSRKKAEANPVAIVMLICHCGKKFRRKSKRHVNCSQKCGQNSDRRLSNIRAKRLREIRMLKRKKEAGND